MLIQIILFLFAGILTGTLTGLIPGIHINLISILLLSFTSTLIINPLYLISFIASMAIAHTFVDFIPSVFLGCPDTDTAISILPAHKLLQKGRGFQAVMLANYGSLIAIGLLIFLVTPLVLFSKNLYTLIENVIPYILIFISLLLIILEKKKVIALTIFSLSGILGLIVLNSQINEPLLPLLTGLFGSSMILISIRNKIILPKQISYFPKVNIIRPVIASIIACPFCTFIPAIGTSQSTVIGSAVIKMGNKEFITLNGIANTLVMSISFISLYTISKTRTGAALAIKEIINNPTIKLLSIILIIIIITSIISFILTVFLAKLAAENINKINYTKISVITLIILITIVLSISGFYGLFVLIISTLAGVYSINQKIRKSHMLGCLILPTIVLYLT